MVDGENELEPNERLSFDESDPEAAVGEDAITAPKSRGQERRSFGHLWLISYADFMTILMIFFLVLYGYAVMGKAKLQEKTITYSDFSLAMGNLKARIGDQLEVVEDQNAIKLNLDEAVLFQSGSAQLEAAASPTLEEIGKSLKLVQGEVIVEGHSDNVAIRGGRYKTNWELSAARSFSVIEALTNQGVEPGRLAAWGFGEHRPKVANLDAVARAKNRRIEIVLMKLERKGQ